MEPKDKANVIDFKARRNLRKKAANPAGGLTPTAKAPVVDMTERRAERLMQDRRKVRRTILTEFIGAHVVVPREGLMKVSLYDVSEDGLSFDLGSEAGGFQAGEEIAMRVYLNYETYFPFLVKVHHVRSIDDEGVFRHGATFVKGTVNEEALHHFVRFIETVSASLETDSGDVTVSRLTSG